MADIHEEEWEEEQVPVAAALGSRPEGAAAVSAEALEPAGEWEIFCRDLVPVSSHAEVLIPVDLCAGGEEAPPMKRSRGRPRKAGPMMAVPPVRYRRTGEAHMDFHALILGALRLE